MEKCNIEFSDNEKEGLKKISEISSKSAAEALSKMINKNVEVDFPSICIEPLDEINKLSSESIISICAVTGDISGNILMSFVKNKGLPLLDMMSYQEIGTFKEVNDDAMGVFNELTNIVGGAYLSALANYLSFRIFPEPPKFIGGLSEVQSQLIGELKENVGEVLLVNTVLKIEGTDVDGTFLILLDKESIGKIINLLSKK